VGVPTTLVVGRRDPFFSATAVRRTAESVTGPFEVRLLDAGHWLPENEPDAVVEAVQRQVRGA
jgi:pimeloyl-ACP methyl ester carboxylesterase